MPRHRLTRTDAGVNTQLLFGDDVLVFEDVEGWAWIQAERDGYVGYMPSEGLTRNIVAPTHRIAALRTYVYPEPDAKTPPLALLSLNARITVAEPGGKFHVLAGGGHVFAGHAVPLEDTARDYVAVAEAGALASGWIAPA